MANESMEELVDRLKAEQKHENGPVIASIEDSAGGVAAAPVQQLEHRRSRKKESSYGGPLILILIGAYFLLRNIGLEMPNLDWGAAFRLWPLFLVFGGINIIASQMKRPLKNILGGLSRLTMVAIFGAALLGVFAGSSGPAGIGSSEIQTEAISYSAEVIDAEIEIDFPPAGGNIFALESGGPIIDGEVNYIGELEFDHQFGSDRADIKLGVDSSVFNFFDNFSNDLIPWQLGLTPDAPLDLEIDMSSGDSRLDLAGLQLSELALDMASGDVFLDLPEGTYHTKIDSASGDVNVTIPNQGELSFVIDKASGATILTLPDSMAARVTVDRASGSFQPTDRFNRIEQDGNDEVWETEGFSNAVNRVDIVIDMASGSVVINER